MKKQELVNTLQNGHDCFFSSSQVIAMLSDIEDAPVEDTKDKVWFTEAHLKTFLSRFKEQIVDDIERNTDTSDLISDGYELSLSGNEIEVEICSFRIRAIENATQYSVINFLDSEELFK